MKQPWLKWSKTSATLLPHCSASSSQWNLNRERKQKYKVGSRIIMFLVNMDIYSEKPRESAQTLLESFQKDIWF